MEEKLYGPFLHQWLKRVQPTKELEIFLKSEQDPLELPIPELSKESVHAVSQNDLETA